MLFGQFKFLIGGWRKGGAERWWAGQFYLREAETLNELLQ